MSPGGGGKDGIVLQAGLELMFCWIWGLFSADTKLETEKNFLSLHPSATIVRPSLVFGPGDSFFTVSNSPRSNTIRTKAQTSSSASLVPFVSGSQPWPTTSISYLSLAEGRPGSNRSTWGIWPRPSRWLRGTRRVRGEKSWLGG